MVYDAGFSEKFLFCAHLRPLERSKWLRNEEGRTRNDLYLAVSLVLRDLVVLLRDLLGKQGDSLHVLHGLCRKTQHEIQLYTVPSALERQRRTVYDIFLCQSLIDNISQSLGTRLRSEGQAALLNILDLAHNVKGESVDTQGRQGDIDAFAVEGIDQECHKLLEASVVTGA